MAEKAAFFQRQLLARVNRKVEWLKGALEVYEGRSETEVEAGRQAFKHWAIDSDNDASDWLLTLAWDEYILQASAWAHDSAKFDAEFPCRSSPQWVLTEFALVASLVLAERALELLLERTSRGLTVAAMLYADSVESQCYWMDLRGPTECRNPNQAFARAFNAIRERENEIAIREAKSVLARKNARRRLERDPRQKAKAQAFSLWKAWQEGREVHENQAAFARHVCEALGLKDASNVEAWCRTWRKGRVS